MVSKGPWRLVLMASVIVTGCDEVADARERSAVAVAADDDEARACAADSRGQCDGECVERKACAGACVAGYCEGPCRPGQVRCDGECVDRTRVPPSGDAREFVFTGAPAMFVVPRCVARLTIEMWGAQGGGSRCCDGTTQDDGGRGAHVRAQLDVEPGEALQIVVGGRGGIDGAAGYNGGGAGGNFAGGGGGASDVRRGGDALKSRILVAAGGGGGQCGCPDHGEGGPGGVSLGGPGIAGLPEWQAGGGGTQSAGGAAGSPPAHPGEPGRGGGGGTYHVAGGWFGGGSAYAAGGGGGSSFLGDDPAASGLPGARTGDGLVTIAW